MMLRSDVVAERCGDHADAHRLSCGRRASAVSVGVGGALDWPAATTKLRVRLAWDCLPSVPGLLLGMTFSPPGYDAKPDGIPVFLMTNSAARDGMR